LPCKISSPIELGSGDQLHSKSIKEEFEQEKHQQISNSNNALIISGNSKYNDDGNRSFSSTDIDETEDDQFKQTIKTLSISTNQSNNDNESQYKKIIKSKNSLHLSDISYTTDYYSQNESD